MSDNTLRIVFAGTPDFAAGHLEYLVAQGFDVVAVYSQPDRKKGRGKKLLPSAVKEVALQHDIPVYQPFNFKEASDINILASLKADVMVVVAYGLLLPENVLNTPKLGCINVHGSLLPRWRGAAPIERAIEAGDTETGITIMQMDKGLDTGDMLNIEKIAISPETTGDALRAALLTPGCEALAATLNDLQAGLLKPVKQDGSQANYAHKLKKLEAKLDWSLSATVIDQKIRAFNSSNVCSSLLNEQVIKIWKAELIDSNTVYTEAGKILALDKKSITVACGIGAIRLQELQLPNSKRMDVAAVLNGRKDLFTEGESFSSQVADS
ncbi:MAG: methionyl-tRNA formyltransferase [Pseudomonadales bacterium]|nr:methionyl-tRNA formyltransferase [Pseudomonadales bacterium]